MDKNLTNKLFSASNVLSTEQFGPESPNRSWFQEVEAFESEHMEVRSIFNFDIIQTKLLIDCNKRENAALDAEQVITYI